MATIKINYNISTGGDVNPTHTFIVPCLPKDYNGLMSLLYKTKHRIIINAIAKKFKENKYKYPLVQLAYASELIQERLSEVS